MEKIERVGIIGLGRMGRPMTRHLIEKGFAVTGFDVSDEAMAAAAALGARKAANPAEVAHQSDLVIVVVGFDSEVEDAVLAPDGLLAGAREGTVIAISSTVAPGTMKRLAAKVEGSGVAFL
ncbi:MAG: NAD(P)-binding domain-containing protein, partial [Alphaproteobacteria bacterium]|nr:NAD(P)-binding domain-containing protein [Alphaproteobacteria bacterium]